MQCSQQRRLFVWSFQKKIWRRFSQTICAYNINMTDPNYKIKLLNPISSVKNECINQKNKGIKNQFLKKMWWKAGWSVNYYARGVCVENLCIWIPQANSMLPLVPPWIVASPFPLVSAHLLYTIFCPRKEKHIYMEISIRISIC